LPRWRRKSIEADTFAIFPLLRPARCGFPSLEGMIPPNNDAANEHNYRQRAEQKMLFSA
jgi:hypothetical protein